MHGSDTNRSTELADAIFYRTAVLAVKKVTRDMRSDLGDNARQFVRRIYLAGLDRYVSRLAAYGFRSRQRVLDAGCGFGQWSLALSRMNKTVSAVDVSAERIRFLKSVTARLGITNLNARIARIDRLPYSDASFDAVFCYSVVCQTPWRETLAEFARVLAPGGVLYVNSNGFGWYKHLWYDEPNKTRDYDPREHAAKALYNSWRYEKGMSVEEGMDILIEPADLTRALRSLGFRGVVCGGEGTLHPCRTSRRPSPFFASSYRGDTGVYEVMARKPAQRKASRARSAHVAKRLRNACRRRAG